MRKRCVMACLVSAVLVPAPALAVAASTVHGGTDGPGSVSRPTRRVTAREAATLPKLDSDCYRGKKYVGNCYQVRPRHLSCQDACGGELTLTWSSWTAKDAFGSGSGIAEEQGHVLHYHVRVEAFSPRNGHFTRLRVAGAAVKTLGGPGLRDLGYGLWGQPV
jgi:hypothetical protein